MLLFDPFKPKKSIEENEMTIRLFDFYTNVYEHYNPFFFDQIKNSGRGGKNKTGMLEHDVTAVVNSTSSIRISPPKLMFVPNK